MVKFMCIALFKYKLLQSNFIVVKRKTGAKLFIQDSNVSVLIFMTSISTIKQLCFIIQVFVFFTLS